VVPSPYCGNNRWLSRVHRELIFSSRGRRHAAQQVFGKAADHASALSPKFNFNSPCSSCSRPRWRRGRDTQPHRRLAREETRVESCKRAPPRRGRLERNSPFFLFPPLPRPPPTGGTRLGRPQSGVKAPDFLPAGVNCILSRKNIWAPQPKVPAAISVENGQLSRRRRRRRGAGRSQ
jgi:hypothetical protein